MERCWVDRVRDLILFDSVQTIHTRCFIKNPICWWHIFEVLQLQPQKNVQKNDRIYVSMGIVSLPHVRATQCTRTSSLQDGCVFGSRDAWFHVSILHSVDTINIFISEPDKVHHRSRVATDSTSWDYQACTSDTLWHQYYVTTSKEYFIFNQLPYVVKIFWISVSLATTGKNFV